MDFVGWKRLAGKSARLFGWNASKEMEDERLQVAVWSVDLIGRTDFMLDVLLRGTTSTVMLS